MADQNTPLKAGGQLKSQAESFRSIWKDWLFSVSRELQPILRQTVVFSTYIVCDLFILWLVGFAFIDITQISHSIVDLLYNGLKIASVLVVSVHFLVSCVIEIQKEKQRTQLLEGKE